MWKIYIFVIIFIFFTVEVVMLHYIFPNFLVDNKRGIFEGAMVGRVPGTGMKFVT